MISFLVLGIRWMSLGAASRPQETVEERYFALGRWSHLLLITCVPFATMLVGRYGEFAPAIWLYWGDYAVWRRWSRCGWRRRPNMHIGWEDALDRRLGLIVIIVVSLIVVVFSLVQPNARDVDFTVLNIFAPALRR